MKKQLLLCELYEYYEGLLTEKQRNYFKLYYFDNLTLSELSENCNVSRNAIHKTIKEVEEKLSYYEEILKLCEKKKIIKKLIVNLDDELKNKIIKNI